MNASTSNLELSRRSILVLAVLILGINPTGHLQLLTPVNDAASIQNTTYYFHHLTTPAIVAGGTTNYVANTTSQFDYDTQAMAMADSFYKGIGQPTLALNFYTYPNFATMNDFNGSWQVIIYANASSYKTVNFGLEFREYAAGSGTAAWDSGQVNPIVTSPVGSYLGAPVNAYNLTIPGALAHVFGKNSTIDITVTLNTGASNDARVWYDSASYPSKIVLPLYTTTSTPSLPSITTSLLLLLVGVILVAGAVVFFVMTGNKRNSPSRAWRRLRNR